MPFVDPTQPPLDVVFTWVDGDWPGYQTELRKHSTRPIELNPNRYRDNLDLLRFSLRSLWQYAAMPLRITLVTQRPQVPKWLSLGPLVRVVHHDEFIDPLCLPTFSSFAIVANLFRLPGLNGRFLYMEDDHLACRPFDAGDLWNERGQPIFWPLRRRTPPGTEVPSAGVHPWKAALAASNYWLDRELGRRPRRELQHAPVPFDLSHRERFLGTFGDVLAGTSRLKFRAPGAVAAEYLYPLFLVEQGLGDLRDPGETGRETSYIGLDNHPWWLGVRLRHWEKKRPLWACLNDNFGPEPDPRSVALVRQTLHRLFPNPSPFERTVDGGE